MKRIMAWLSSRTLYSLRSNNGARTTLAASVKSHSNTDDTEHGIDKLPNIVVIVAVIQKRIVVLFQREIIELKLACKTVFHKVIPSDLLKSLAVKLGNDGINSHSLILSRRRDGNVLVLPISIDIISDSFDMHDRRERCLSCETVSLLPSFSHMPSQADR